MHFYISWHVLTSSPMTISLSFLTITEKTFVTVCSSLPRHFAFIVLTKVFNYMPFFTPLYGNKSTRIFVLYEALPLFVPHYYRWVAAHSISSWFFRLLSWPERKAKLAFLKSGRIKFWRTQVTSYVWCCWWFISIQTLLNTREEGDFLVYSKHLSSCLLTHSPYSNSFSFSRQ